jgi:MAPEG family
LYKRSDTGERENAVGISARYLESLENNVQHRLRFKRFCHVDAVAVATEGIRTFLVLTGRVAANGFTPENEGLTPFMQRLARAHANCIEGLPIFGGLWQSQS